MDHDPLCPNAKGCSHDCGGCSCNLDAFCQCDLIAKVRADQDRRNVARELTRDAQDMGLIP
jgi:hypothetical protein